MFFFFNLDIFKTKKALYYAHGVINIIHNSTLHLNCETMFRVILHEGYD